MKSSLVALCFAAVPIGFWAESEQTEVLFWAISLPLALFLAVLTYLGACEIFGAPR